MLSVPLGGVACFPRGASCGVRRGLGRFVSEPRRSPGPRACGGAAGLGTAPRGRHGLTSRRPAEPAHVGMRWGGTLAGWSLPRSEAFPLRAFQIWGELCLLSPTI